MKVPGKQIKTIEELLKQKRSVWVKTWKRCSPMAFIISMPVRTVNNMIKGGVIFTAEDAK